MNLADSLITPKQKRLLEEKGWVVQRQDSYGAVIVHEESGGSKVHLFVHASTDVHGDLPTIAPALSILGLLPANDEMVLVPKEVAKAAALFVQATADEKEVEAATSTGLSAKVKRMAVDALRNLYAYLAPEEKKEGV